MRRALICGLLLAGLAVAGGVAILAYPSACRAGYCPTYTCYAPCGQGCVCVTPPGTYGGGTCYGVQAVPHLLERGWHIYTGSPQVTQP